MAVLFILLPPPEAKVSHVILVSICVRGRLSLQSSHTVAYIALVAITGTTNFVPYHAGKSLQLTWRSVPGVDYIRGHPFFKLIAMTWQGWDNQGPFTNISNFNPNKDK